jgi:hypothetical protein
VRAVRRGELGRVWFVIEQEQDVVGSIRAGVIHGVERIDAGCVCVDRDVSVRRWHPGRVHLQLLGRRCVV